MRLDSSSKRSCSVVVVKKGLPALGVAVAFAESRASGKRAEAGGRWLPFLQRSRRSTGLPARRRDRGRTTRVVQSLFNAPLEVWMTWFGSWFGPGDPTRRGNDGGPISDNDGGPVAGTDGGPGGGQATGQCGLYTSNFDITVVGNPRPSRSMGLVLQTRPTTSDQAFVISSHYLSRSFVDS
jgi:hypothetical protein